VRNLAASGEKSIAPLRDGFSLPTGSTLLIRRTLFRGRGTLDRWDAPHFAQDLFGGLDGDVRVEHDTIVVTHYNAPHPDQLRPQYENLPAKLAAEGLCPHVPWLYNSKLDFRFT